MVMLNTSLHKALLFNSLLNYFNEMMQIRLNNSGYFELIKSSIVYSASRCFAYRFSAAFASI
jgi:hypothetical protein